MKTLKLSLTKIALLGLTLLSSTLVMANDNRLESSITVSNNIESATIYLSNFPANSLIIVSDSNNNLISVTSSNNEGIAVISFNKQITKTIIAKTVSGNVLVTYYTENKKEPKNINSYNLVS